MESAKNDHGRRTTAMGLTLALLVLGILLLPRWFRGQSPETPPPRTRTVAPEDVDGSFSTGKESADEGRSLETRLEMARKNMVEHDLGGRDIRDPRVLKAMGQVPRHQFVPDNLLHRAYADTPLPIGHGQTISQPYIVALSSQLVAPKPGEKALDVGTGSGYQAAVLAKLCKEVYSIEILRPLASEAKKRLEEQGYKNVTVRHGDGYRGWPEQAPFDVIVVAAAPDHIPKALVSQLAPGGRMVIPVGRNWQEMILIEKEQDGSVKHRSIIPVAFVPMTGEAEKK